MERKSLGRQLLIELFGCDRDRLDDSEGLEKALREAARLSGATIVESVFHRFMPHGVSGVVVISESHLAIHTWPEHGYAAIDFFTCGEEVDYWRAYVYLKDFFAAGRAEAREIRRGGWSDGEGRLVPGPPETSDGAESV